MGGSSKERSTSLSNCSPLIISKRPFVSVTATDRDEIWVRQRGASEAHIKCVAGSDEAAGRKYRPRCEQLLP